MSKKKNLPDNILKLKNQLETGNNLFDYFLVCGCDPSICFTEKKLFKLTSDKNTNLKNLQKIIKLKMITKFPEFDNNNDTVDDAILSYCFPYGFKPYYNDSGKINEKKFSIILDNNLSSSAYPHKYLTCLLFYESLAQYKELSDEYFGNKKKGKVNINNDELDSFNNTEEDFELIQNNANINKKSKSDLTRSTSEAKIENSYKYERTSTKAEVTGVKSLTKISNVYKYKCYFIPKCICIVSIHPNIKLFQEILTLVYRYSLSYQNLPIEKIITNLLIEVPVAPRGLYNIKFTLFNSLKNLTQTENNKLLLTEIDLRNFYKNINLDIQIEVIKHLMFGTKVIVFSKNVNKLTETILAFLFLMFPFKYSFPVASYLNKSNYIILESCFPYFLGVNETYNSEFFEKNDILIEDTNLFIVDLDKNKSELLSTETFPAFPSKLINNLIKDIKNIEKNYNKEGEDHEQEQEEDNENEEEDEIKYEEKEYFDEEKFNSSYQNTFFYFMCELIKNYEDYLNMNYFKNTQNVVTNIETLFNCDDFIKYHPSSDIPFYTKFVKDSQLFTDFICKRMIPKNNQEIIDILLVNDTLTKIKNKNKFFGKDPTDFSDSTEYSVKNTYEVQGARQLTEMELKDIKKNIDKLKKKGQIIQKNLKKEKDKGENPITFKYKLFPELYFDIYFNNDNANEYCLPPVYSEEIEAINVDVISKSSLGQTMNRQLEMINYLYLSWLEVWAFTFWYFDKKEKQYRFNQMIDVLNKVIHHEMNILNLLFDALSKSSENEMILKLYRKLIDLNINPSSFIYSIISSITDKIQLRIIKESQVKSSQLKLDDNELKYKNCNINQNPNLKRTFSSIEDHLEINQKLKFYTNFSCIECGEKINLLNICKDFTDVKNDILWVPCKCGEYNLPKIKVRFGVELLRDKTYKTSSLDEIVIHSPYNLKINLKNAVMKNYGMNLIVTDFKSQFMPLFWNFIWYCKIHKLDYEIILPYLKDIIQLRKIKYKNRAKEIFEIKYEDKYYSENLNKIEKYSKTIYERFVNKTKQKKIRYEDLEENHEINMEFIEEKKIIEENKILNKIEVDNVIQENEKEIEEEENEEENEINNIEEENENNEEEEEINNEDDNMDNNIEYNIEKEQNEESEKTEENQNDDNKNIEENKGEEIEQKEEEDNNEEEQKMEVVEENNEEKEDDNKNEDEEEEQMEVNEENQEEKIEEKENIIEEEIKVENNEEIKNEEVVKVNGFIIGDKYIEEKEKKEEPKEILTNNKMTIKEQPKKKNVNEIEKKINVKPTDLNIELKKVMESKKPIPTKEEINTNLKKLDKSVMVKPPKPEMKINYKLKKISDISQSQNVNINSGENFLAELKKKLKKVGTKDVQ